MKKITALILCICMVLTLAACSSTAKDPDTTKAPTDGAVDYSCDVTRSVSKMTEIERRGGKRWDKPKKAGKSRDCRGGKF